MFKLEKMSFFAILNFYDLAPSLIFTLCVRRRNFFDILSFSDLTPIVN